MRRLIQPRNPHGHKDLLEGADRAGINPRRTRRYNSRGGVSPDAGDQPRFLLRLVHLHDGSQNRSITAYRNASSR
jgi:hypothetical protein